MVYVTFMVLHVRCPVEAEKMYRKWIHVRRRKDLGKMDAKGARIEMKEVRAVQKCHAVSRVWCEGEIVERDHSDIGSG